MSMDVIGFDATVSLCDITPFCSDDELSPCSVCFLFCLWHGLVKGRGRPSPLVE